MTHPPSPVVSAYRSLLRLAMPESFLRELEAPMVDTFDELYRSAKRERSVARFLLSEILGLLSAAISERRGRAHPRARKKKATRRSSMWDRFAQDWRYALRAVLLRPAVSLVVVVTIALGIGASIATFGVVQAVVLQPLAYRDPGRLAAIFNRWDEWDRPHALSVPELVDYRERARSFQSIGAFYETSVNLTGDGEPERLAGYRVTANLFPLLGIEPQWGRAFTPEEEREGAASVVLSGELFSRRFGARPEMVGSSIVIDGETRPVLGVMPVGFRLPPDLASETPAQIYLVAPVDPAEPGNRGSHGITALGRLREDVPLSEASAELDAIARALTEEGHYKEAMRFSTYAISLEEDVVGDVRGGLFFLLGAVNFVLLIAAANVANLLLVRSESRRAEIAMRAALGAGRGRLAGQLLMESSVLVVGGTLLGLLVASLALKLLLLASPGGLPRLAETRIDGPVLAFAVLTMGAVGLLVGLWPAFRLGGARLERTVNEIGRSVSSPATSRFLTALAVTQVGLAAMLLLGATLMTRSFGELVGIEPGFRPQGVLTFRLALPSSSYPEPENVISFYERLRASLLSIPGVGEAGAVRSLPLASSMGTWNIDIEDEPVPDGEVRASAHWQLATPGYLESMGIPLLAGRTIEERDRSDSEPVVVVNQRFVVSHWPDESALGKRIRVGRARDGAPWLRIVGVVGDVRHNGIAGEIHPRWYVPHAQWPLSRGFAWRDMAVVLRLDTDAARPLGMMPSVQAVLRELDPELPLTSPRAMDAVLAGATARPRFLLFLLASFSALALGIASVGLYGVLAHSVTRRSREIGLRMALGADRARLIKMILGRALAVSTIGVGVGLILAASTTGVMSGLLYGIGAFDPLSFIVVPIIVTAVALIAAAAPAMKASRIDPIRALADE